VKLRVGASFDEGRLSDTVATILRRSKRKDEFRSRHVFFVNVGASHWCVVCIDGLGDGKAARGACYNSRPSLSDRGLCEAFRNVLVPDFCASVAFEAPTCPGQRNNNDCGVFSCMFAAHLAHRRPVPQEEDAFDERKILQFRGHIASRILRCIDETSRDRALAPK
jgi:Ulp1 family protease